MEQGTRLDRCRCIKVEPARPEVGCTNGPGLWDQLLPNLLLAGRRCPRSAFRKRVTERGTTSHVHPHAPIHWCKSTRLDGWCHVHLPSTPSPRWPGPTSSSTPIGRTTPLTGKISPFLPHLFRVPSRNLRPCFSTPWFFLHVLSGRAWFPRRIACASRRSQLLSRKKGASTAQKSGLEARKEVVRNVDYPFAKIRTDLRGAGAPEDLHVTWTWPTSARSRTLLQRVGLGFGSESRTCGSPWHKPCSKTTPRSTSRRDRRNPCSTS